MVLPKKNSLFLVLLFFVAINFAFNINNYLYPEENQSIVSEFDIVANGKDYSLVMLDNITIIFLLEQGELEGVPVEDQEEITSILYSYYKSTSYPTEEEINDIKELIVAFNASRSDNGSGIMGLKEEKLCLANLFMLTLQAGEVVDLFPCYDQESCELTELMFCSAIGEKPFSMCRPGDMTEDFKQISFASRGLDSLIANFSEKISFYDESTLYPNLVYVRENLDELEEYATDIDSSVFQTPDTIGDDCYHVTTETYLACFQICGVLDLNQEAIVPELESDLDTVITKMEPFSKYEETSENVYMQTTERLLYKENKELREDYLSLYIPLYEEADKLLTVVNETLSTKITNKSLEDSMEDLDALGKELNFSIENFNFTDIDDQFKDYKKLVNKTENQLSSMMVVYNSTMESKSEAELYLFILSLKDLDPSLEEQLLEIDSQKLEIDENLTKSIPTTSKMYAINSSYSLVTQSLMIILQKQEENIVFLQLRAFARKVNSNLHSLLEILNDLTYEKRTGYSQSMPLLLSGLNFLSISSLGAFLFLAMIGRVKFRSIIHLALSIVPLLVFGFLVLLFSVGFYFYLDKTTNSADLNEFLLSISSIGNSAIVINLNNASSSASLSMKECASALAVSLVSHNKTVDIYELDNGCIKNGIRMENVSSQKCLDQIDAPIFYFNYTTSEVEPKVSSIFVNQLTIGGNAEYYDKCDIASIFKVVSFGE